jgi:hypothetical protein
MKTTGYQLCDLLRKTADETANPERALIMTWAADEVEHLLDEIRILKRDKARLVDACQAIDNERWLLDPQCQEHEDMLKKWRDAFKPNQ